jgi:hypothetical protein
MTDTAWTAPTNGRADLAAGADLSWLPRMVWRVALDDGRQWVVSTDQRDQRRAMVTCGIQDAEADKIGFAFAVCWAALTRTHQLELGWAAFQDQVAGVAPVADDDDDDAAAEELGRVDPTRTAAVGVVARGAARPGHDHGRPARADRGHRRWLRPPRS